MTKKGKLIAGQEEKQNKDVVPGEDASLQPQSPQEVAVVAHRAEFSLHSGPLPPPEDLAKYNMVVPDAAERILRMAEQQAAHRMEIEKTVIRSDVQRSLWGQIIAGAVSVLCLLTGYGFARLGHPVEGASLITANMVTLVTVFITGRAMQKREREEKAQLQAGKPPQEKRQIPKKS